MKKNKLFIYYTVFFLYLLFFVKDIKAGFLSMDVNINDTNNKYYFDIKNKKEDESFFDYFNKSFLVKILSDYEDIDVNDFINGRMTLNILDIPIIFDLVQDTEEGITANLTDPLGIFQETKFIITNNPLLDGMISTLTEASGYLIEKLKDKDAQFFKKISNSFFQTRVSTTENSIIAGNPHSLMNQMINNEYYFSNNINNNKFPIIVSYFSKKLTEKNSSTFDIAFPLNFLIRIGSKGSGIKIDLPIQYISLNKKKIGNFQFGLGFKLALTDYWVLNFGGRIGLAGSMDAYDFGVLYSENITSNLRFNLFNNKTSLNIVNSFSYLGSFKIQPLIKSFANKFIEDDEYKFLINCIPEYHISNFAFKNGIDFKYYFDIKEKFILKFEFINTFFIGRTKLYIQYYNDISAQFVLNKLFTFKMSYRFGDKKYKSLNFGINFNYYI